MTLYLKQYEKIFVKDEIITIDTTGEYEITEKTIKLIKEKKKTLNEPVSQKRYLIVGDLEDQNYYNKNLF